MLPLQIINKSITVLVFTELQLTTALSVARASRATGNRRSNFEMQILAIEGRVRSQPRLHSLLSLSVLRIKIGFRGR